MDLVISAKGCKSFSYYRKACAIYILNYWPWDLIYRHILGGKKVVIRNLIQRNHLFSGISKYVIFILRRKNSYLVVPYMYPFITVIDSICSWNTRYLYCICIENHLQANWHSWKYSKRVLLCVLCQNSGILCLS